ncbi:MAG: hypothetical protein ACXVI3_06570 [Halobacteriota archaeon]
MEEAAKKSIETITEEITALNEEIIRISERDGLGVDIGDALKLIVSNIRHIQELSDITNQRIERLAAGVSYPYV